MARIMRLLENNPLCVDKALLVADTKIAFKENYLTHLSLILYHRPVCREVFLSFYDRLLSQSVT